MTDDIRVNTSRRSENNIGPRHRNSVTQQLVNSGASNLQISNVSYFIDNLFYELSSRQRKFKSFKQILFRMKDSWKIQYSFRFIVRMGAQDAVSLLQRISLFRKILNIIKEEYMNLFRHYCISQFEFYWLKEQFPSSFITYIEMRSCSSHTCTNAEIFSVNKWFLLRMYMYHVDPLLV